MAADGAREGKPGEADRVEQVRKIATEVDWPCEVKTLFRDENLGCKQAVSSGIDWFFNNEKQGIILEDDCLPESSFFIYCEGLLNKYKNDQRIGMIAGCNFNIEINSNESSYDFARFYPVWGWATWADRWNSDYDVNLKNFDMAKYGGWMGEWFVESTVRVKMENLFRMVRDGLIDTWDYQWYFSNISNNRLCIIPAKNQVVNIGFGSDATHTIEKVENLLTTNVMKFPLIHPVGFFAKKSIEVKMQRILFGNIGLIGRVVSKLKLLWGVK